MSRTFGSSLLGMTVVFAVTVMAEKPTKEFSDIMKSNGAIVDIRLGTNSGPGGSGLDTAPLSLPTHIRAKDYDGIVKDATTLKANFARVETFWTERKVDDAIKFSKAAIKAATDLEAAAKTKNDAGITAAQRAIATTCAGCHQSHRVIVLADGTFEIT